MSLTLLKIAGIGALSVVLTGAFWRYTSRSRVYCGSVPRRVFSSDELHWLDSASNASYASYRGCIVSQSNDVAFVSGLGGDTAVVKLPGVTTEDVETRTGWRVAPNHCPLGEQDVVRVFGGVEDAQWIALTWNGSPAVCHPKLNQLPEEVLVRGQTTYDLFPDNNDGLSGYL